MVVSFYYGILHVAFILCLYLIFIWGIEDLLVDIYYWTRAIYRRLFVYTKYPRLNVEDLYKKEEEWIVDLPHFDGHPVRRRWFDEREKPEAA